MLNFKSIIGIMSIIQLLFSGNLFAEVYEYTENNRLTLHEDARVSVEEKIELVKKAKHHIHIMSYYWDRKGFPLEMMKELRHAHRRGVDVRIMTSYLPSLAKDFFGKSEKVLFSREGRRDSDAILAYLKLMPRHLGTITSNIHEKVFLIDGRVAIIGGRNISDNDFRAKDIEIELEGPVVNQVQEHFRRMFSFLIDYKIKRDCSDEDAQLDCPDRLGRLNFDRGNKHFFPDQPLFSDGFRARILTNEVLIQQKEKKYIGAERFAIKDDIIDTIIKTEFTTMRAYNYFVIPTERYRLFLEKNLENPEKEIKIISNSRATAAVITDKGYLFSLPGMRNLVEKGLQVHQWLGMIAENGDNLLYLHEKVIMFDDDHGIIGSHNFGLGSTLVSSEIAVEFYSKPIVKRLIEVFDTEYNDRAITQIATLPFLEQEMKDYKTTINLLQKGFLKTMISEIY